MTSLPVAPAPGHPSTSTIDPSSWHRRLCDVGGRLVVSGDLPADPSDARSTLASWVDAGITGIVDCRGEWSDEPFVRAAAPGLDYAHVGVDDDGTRRSDRWFDDGVAAATELLERRSGKVLVHCHMGVNRGPSMAYAVLLSLGHDHVAALDAIRSARPIAALIYAEDAVRWWARRNGAEAATAARMAREVRRWHADNDIDVANVVRRIRGAA